MGRHTDPQTLDFIRKLREKGDSLGYKTAEEQPLLGGLYWADLTWSLAEGQPPLVTFEVETEESLRVFKNTAKYFDTLSKDVPKPYRHFAILVRGRLSEGIRLPMQRFINYYNVSLFEDVANDNNAVRILFEELDRLKVGISELVARYLSAGKIDETLQEVERGIRKGMPSFLSNPENITINIGSEPRPDPLRPFRFQLNVKTQAGEPTLLQRMQDAAKTGEPVRFTKENHVKIKLPGQEETEVESLEIRAETVKGVPSRLETSNYENYLELVLAPESGNDEILVVSNASQGAPYKIGFKIYRKTNHVEISVNFSIDDGDPYQLVYFIDFVERAKKENRLMLRRIDGKVMLEGPFTAEFEPLSEQWMRILRTLAEIQIKTGIRLPIPKNITENDLKAISKLYQIIAKGEVEVEVKSLTVNFTKEQAQYRVDLVKNPDIIENFQANLGDETVELFGKKIPVGDSQIVIPRAKVDLNRLQEGLTEGNASIPTMVMPVAGETPVRVIYRNWTGGKQ